MVTPGRNWVSDAYRYGHNGQEKEDEIAKGINSAEYWMYDSRLGRRWEADPLTYEWQSSYVTFNNNPILYSDPSGLEGEAASPPDRITMTYNEESGSYEETARTSEFGPDVNLTHYVGGAKDGVNEVSTNGMVTFKNGGFEPRKGSFTHWNSMHASEYRNRLEAFKAWQGYPGEHEGESKWDRLIRIAAYSSMEARREFASGGTMMFNGIGSTAGAVENTAVNLETRAAQIHGVLNKVTQSKTTVAAADVITAEGNAQVWLASSEKALRPAQRAMLKSNEVAIKGTGHAEATIINHAKSTGATVLRVAASRPICPSCATTISNAGAAPASALKSVTTFGGGR